MYSVEELKNIELSDFRKMSDKERKNILKSMKSKINRRLKGLEKKRYKSTIALSQLKTATNEDKRLNPLNVAKKWSEKIDVSTNFKKQNKDFLIAKKFLKAQTSTSTGHEKWIKHLTAKVGNADTLKKYNRKQLSTIFQLVESIREAKPGLFTTAMDSNQTISLIIQSTKGYINKMTYSELKEYLLKQLKGE